MPDQTISRLTLELWALGKLEPERTAALVDASQRDPTLAARMLKVRTELQSAAVGLPPLTLPADEEAPAGWLSWLLRPGLIAGLAVAAAVLLVVVPQLTTPQTSPGVFAYRGDFDLQIHRIRQDAAVPVGALIEARPGDRLQYTITPRQDGHLAICNLQDDGQLQVYHPSQPVTAGQAVTEAVVLDDYAGSERIFFLLNDEPISEDTVRGAVQRAFRSPLADLDALPGAADAQRSVLIVKEAP